MSLDNKTVLENLIKQRKDVMEQLESARTTLLKLEGAIDVLQQIEEANQEPEVSQTEVVESEDE
tara:strand:+ start:286 stop:477 length:192 start_codon:yes stop_codon:yes gene_type:complete